MVRNDATDAPVHKMWGGRISHILLVGVPQGAMKTNLTAVDGNRAVKIVILPVVVVRQSKEVRRIHRIPPIHKAKVFLVNAGPGAVPRKRP